jgi:hypothetical protein
MSFRYYNVYLGSCFCKNPTVQHNLTQNHDITWTPTIQLIHTILHICLVTNPNKSNININIQNHWFIWNYSHYFIFKLFFLMQEPMDNNSTTIFTKSVWKKSVTLIEALLLLISPLPYVTKIDYGRLKL